MAWASGQRLQSGKYTVEQELGQGGFGITYRAKDDNGKLFVIKTLNDKVQRHPDFAKFQQDFLNEALRLARCSYPHIVRIDEVIQEGALWCIVMEYIDGEDLANRVENQGALSEAEALRYIQQIGEALTVIHNKGLLHRDIKPTNIMLRSNKSEAVLIDFGIARDFTPNLTQTHTQFLSDGFAPIEQYDKRAKRGAYTDVYALAATLYSLVTAEVPTLSPLRAAGMPLEPPKQINSRLSDKVNQVILKGMEVKAGDRPQSMQEWLALLKPPIISKVSFSPVVEVDYSQLEQLLEAGSWRKADKETTALMLKIAHRETEDWLDVKDIQNFPCQDLHTINQLWSEYSKGHFGFSLQKRIWQSIGGKPNADYETWRRFSERVGWRVKSSWKNYSDLSFTLYALEGHLPGGIFMLYCGFGIWVSRLSALASRLANCNIQ